MACLSCTESGGSTLFHRSRAFVGLVERQVRRCQGANSSGLCRGLSRKYIGPFVINR